MAEHDGNLLAVELQTLRTEALARLGRGGDVLVRSQMCRGDDRGLDCLNHARRGGHTVECYRSRVSTEY